MIVDFSNYLENIKNNSIYTSAELEKISQLEKQIAEQQIKYEFLSRNCKNSTSVREAFWELINLYGRLCQIYQLKWTQQEINGFNDVCQKQRELVKRRMQEWTDALPADAVEKTICACDFIIEAALELKLFAGDALKKLDLYENISCAEDIIAAQYQYLKNIYPISTSSEQEILLFTVEEMICDALDKACNNIIFTFQLLKNQWEKQQENNLSDFSLITSAYATIPCLGGQLLSNI